MLNLSRLPYAVLVGCLTAILLNSAPNAQPVSEAQSEEYSAPYITEKTQNAWEAISPAFLFDAIRKISRALESFDDNSNSPDRDKREQNYLAAQWEMVHWAKFMFWVAAVQAALSVAGIWFIWNSLKLNRTATTAAVKAAEIADKAVVAGHRPWVSIKPNIISSLTFKDGEGRVSIGFELKNHGSSPAINVEIVCEIVPYMHMGLDALAHLVSQARNRKVSRLKGYKIFPNEEFRYGLNSLISQKSILSEITKVGIPEMRVAVSPVVVGYVVYNSIFNDENHVSEFIGYIAKQNPTAPNARLMIDTVDGETALDDLRLDKGFGGDGSAS